MDTKVLSVALVLVVVASVVMVVTAAEAPNREEVFSHREGEEAVLIPALASTVTFSLKQEVLTSAIPLKGVRRWQPCTALCT